MEDAVEGRRKGLVIMMMTKARKIWGTEGRTELLPI